MNLTDSLNRRIAESAGVPIDSLEDDDHIHDDLGIPSVEMIRLVGVFEQEHDVSISDEEIDGVNTVGDVIALVATKKRPR